MFTTWKAAELDASGPATLMARARLAGSPAVAAAENVAQDAAQNAAMVARNAGQGVRHGVVRVRTWAAPRLDGAADYCTATVAPAVSSALRATARQVSPAEAAGAPRRRASWPLLAAVGLAGAGAVAAAVRHGSRTAVTADSESNNSENEGEDSQDRDSTDKDTADKDTADDEGGLPG